MRPILASGRTAPPLHGHPSSRPASRGLSHAAAFQGLVDVDGPDRLDYRYAIRVLECACGSRGSLGARWSEGAHDGARPHRSRSRVGSQRAGRDALGLVRGSNASGLVWGRNSLNGGTLFHLVAQNAAAKELGVLSNRSHIERELFHLLPRSFKSKYQLIIEH